MRALDAAGQAPARTQFDAGDVDAALAAAAHTVSASYAYHYQGHMPIGPSCAVADVTRPARSCSRTRRTPTGCATMLSLVLGLPPSRVRVAVLGGRGSFGNGPARFDTGDAAAVMSQLAGAPVRLQFMRWDEHGWDNYSPALLADLRGGVDERGNIVALRLHRARHPRDVDGRRTPTSQNVGIPLCPPGLGSATVANSGTQYDIPNRRVTGKSLPVWDMFFKTSALRAPALPADLLRDGAARRRARPRGRHRPVPLPPAERPDRAGERRLRPVARRARRRRAARRLASRASPPRRLRRGRS